MKTNVVFRPAVAADLEKIVATYNASVPGRLATADTEPVSVESKRKWFEDHVPGFRPLLVLECDGVYAGWLSFNSFYGRPAYNGTAEVSIYLENNFHGKGLGKICLKKAIETAPQISVHTLLGFIFGHNEASLKLFYGFGFEKWAHLPEVAVLDGLKRDLLILGKKVTS